MTQDAKVLQNTPLYPEPDVISIPLFDLIENTDVKVLKKNDVWCFVEYNFTTGYCKRKDLGILSEKTSNIMISIPKEHAVSLYEALKFALKK